MSQTETLPPKQAAAIAALLTQNTASAAAAAAGVGRATLQRWQGDPTFKAALAAAELQVIDQSVRKLLGLKEAALAVLSDFMATGTPAIKLRAALSVLELGTRLRDLRNEEQRLAELEQRLAELESEGKLKNAHRQ